MGLIPLGQPGNEEHDKAVREKLKGSSSDRRKIAQRIAGIKKANPERVEDKLLALVTDPKVSALDIVFLLDFIMKNGLEKGVKPEVLIQLANAKIKAHQAIFGQTSKNLNVNLDLTQDELNKKIFELISNERSNITERNEGTSSEVD